MIIIYEKSDLVEGAPERAEFDRPKWTDIKPEARISEAYANTVYTARQDGRFQMTKSRMAPLDPYPVRITITRAIQDET